MQSKAELDKVHTASMLKTVYFAINEFKCDWTSTKEEVRLGHPVEATTLEMVEKSIASSWKIAE